MRLLKLVPDNTNLKFVSLRKWAFGLTILLSVLRSDWSRSAASTWASTLSAVS